MSSACVRVDQSNGSFNQSIIQRIDQFYCEQLKNRFRQVYTNCLVLDFLVMAEAIHHDLSDEELYERSKKDIDPILER